MNELIFRGKDLYGHAKYTRLAMLGALLVVQVAFGAYRLGAVATYWMVGATLAVAAPLALMVQRSWSRVGADGVTVCWGLGRGRTHSWQDISWVDVRETKSRQYGNSRAARIFLADGRRRSLPGLQDSATYPRPDFDADVQRVLNWWEHSTHQDTRIQPARKLRDRLSPTVIGVLAGIVIAVAGFVVIATQQH
ncbi:hypothetical protein [Kitasatospora sp. NBC_01300]|uniref:hypothetical protein n=1 Tax=Kitasatospora sp. NBC_01300 TaxID=2903574 RepID=UPI002F90C1C7|nr:hypothetical protein OG556_33875 [Kitasatospora sp. NBC_01300]